VKLNGKTNLAGGDPVSGQICSVDEAIELGAVAVGYSIYIGSVHEKEMLQEFAKIQKEAHKKDLPVIKKGFTSYYMDLSSGEELKRKKERRIIGICYPYWFGNRSRYNQS